MAKLIEMVATKRQAEKSGEMMTVIEERTYSQVRFHHAVESSLTLESNEEGTVLREVSPVLVDVNDPGLKLSWHKNMRVLIGSFDKDAEVFCVMPLDEMQRMLDDEIGVRETWKYAAPGNLDILVRTSWTVTDGLFIPHSSQQERDVFVKAMKDRGAEFVQISSNTGFRDIPQWGINHIVYPFRIFADQEFLPIYMERKQNTRAIYDFNHRGGHTFRLPKNVKRA